MIITLSQHKCVYMDKWLVPVYILGKIISSRKTLFIMKQPDCGNWDVWKDSW